MRSKNVGPVTILSFKKVLINCACLSSACDIRVCDAFNHLDTGILLHCSTRLFYLCYLKEEAKVAVSIDGGGDLPAALRPNRQERHMPLGLCMRLLPHAAREEDDETGQVTASHIEARRCRTGYILN